MITRQAAPQFLAFLPLTLALAAPQTLADGLTDRRSSVASAGDVNGDGFCDLAVAERGHGAVGFMKEGPEPTLDRIWILSGKDGKLLRTLLPPEECPAFGRALENVGDLNGDGIPELAVSGGGPLWVFSGADGSVLFELAGDLACSGFGRSLDGGEDVDGDGTPDLVVHRAAHRGSGSRGDLVLLYSGATGELIRALGFAPESPRPEWQQANIYGTLSGISMLDAVALLPDRDGDGRAELAVCVQVNDDPKSKGTQALLEVLDPMDMSSLQRSALISPGCSGGHWVIRNLGDADGDGVDDVLLSIVDWCVLLLSGATGEELRRHSYEGGTLAAEGTSLDVVGDLNGDGVAEYLIGANEEIDTDPGFAVLYSGASGEVLHSLIVGMLSHLPEGSLMVEAPVGKGVGIDTCALGDANGDGVPDIAIHMPAMEEVRVLSGTDFSVLVTVSLTPLLEHNSE